MINQCSVRNILLTVSYDGTNFCGWQKQTKHTNETARTVQGELEKALKKLHKHEVKTFGSGRTDSGVHACGQCVNFFTDIQNIGVNNFLPALNSILPKDIRIMNAEHVSDKLHARFNALFRTYRYFIRFGRTIFAHEQPYCWHIRKVPDIEKLNRSVSCLHGELDCSAFSAAGDQSKSKHRFIKKAEFFRDGQYLVFEITANAFLWKMVRSITGSLIHFEATGKSEGYFKKVLESKERHMAGPTAPPSGLFLWSIDYPAELRAAPANYSY